MRQSASEWYEDNIDKYEDARDAAFSSEFVEFLDTLTGVDGAIEANGEDIQGFLECFTFPNQEEWLEASYKSALGDYEDVLYDRYKERQMERWDGQC